MSIALLPNAEGKVAFVTGAGGGIGRAVVATLRDAGARVAAADVQGLDKSTEGYLPLETDVTDERQVIASIGSAAFRLGKLDYVIHCAGAVGERGTAADMSLEDWQQVVDRNLTSAFLVTKQAYARLNKPGASVVLFSSTNGRTGGTAFSGAAYGAAKAGILNLARYLAREWAPEGVRVNCIAPGPVDTPMVGRLSETELREVVSAIPLGRIAAPEEVAAAVGFLCSDYAASITGAVMNISGGLVLD